MTVSLHKFRELITSMRGTTLT